MAGYAATTLTETGTPVRELRDESEEELDKEPDDENEGEDDDESDECDENDGDDVAVACSSSTWDDVRRGRFEKPGASNPQEGAPRLP